MCQTMSYRGKNFLPAGSRRELRSIISERANNKRTGGSPASELGAFNKKAISPNCDRVSPSVLIASHFIHFNTA